ncbi:hypothetical protein TNCV_3129871 [Trichonephila clavipes]|nr:hypothetical protein TNCV_3129871 [Trichonephila clavipes]
MLFVIKCESERNITLREQEVVAVLPTVETGEAEMDDPVFSRVELKIVRIKEVVGLARQINLEVDDDDVQELLDSHDQELKMDELIEMREQEQDIEELVSLDLIQSEYQMRVENWTESLSF